MTNETVAFLVLFHNTHALTHELRRRFAAAAATAQTKNRGRGAESIPLAVFIPAP